MNDPNSRPELKIDYQSSYADDVNEKSNTNYDPYEYVYSMYDVDYPEEFDFNWEYVE